MKAAESKLTYFKWFLKDVDIMREQLTMEQAGELFIAVMDYLKDGTITDVSPAIKWPYADFMKKVDMSREAYDKKCATLAANGAMGGKVKAENSKRGQDAIQTVSPKKFTPPTKKQFTTAVERMVENGDISDDVAEYDIDELYDTLAENSWKIDGEPIQRRGDWEDFIAVKFPSEYVKRNMGPLLLHLLAPAFMYLFKRFNGLRDDGSGSLASSVARDFFEEYDEKSGSWIIQDEGFPLPQWKDAIEKYALQQPDVKFS